MINNNQQRIRKIKRPLLLAGVLFCVLFIAALTILLIEINKCLNNLAIILEQTAEQHLTADIALNTSLPRNSNFQVADAVMIGIIIPVYIPLSETALASYFRNLTQGLRGLIKLNNNE